MGGRRGREELEGCWEAERAEGVMGSEEKVGLEEELEDGKPYPAADDDDEVVLGAMFALERSSKRKDEEKEGIKDSAKWENRVGWTELKIRPASSRSPGDAA